MRYLPHAALAILTVLAIVAVAVTLPLERGPRYSRADCMVQVDLRYPQDISDEEKLDNENHVFRMLGMMAALVRREWPISGLTFGNYDRSKLFFTYKDECEARFDYTQRTVSAFNVDYGHLAKLTVRRGRVAPSFRETICFYGAAWKDGDDC